MMAVSWAVQLALTTVDLSVHTMAEKKASLRAGHWAAYSVVKMVDRWECHWADWLDSRSADGMGS